MTEVELIKALIVTAEVLGHPLPKMAIEPMASELMHYESKAVGQALRRCQRELQGRLTLAAILERLPAGHPGIEEAWSMCPRSEADTVVWTDEMSEAFAAAQPLLAAGDGIAARMAFKETYGRLLGEARAAHTPARWNASLGHDVGARQGVLRRAVERGLLKSEHVERLTAGTEAEALPVLTSGEHERPPASVKELLASVKKHAEDQSA